MKLTQAQRDEFVQDVIMDVTAAMPKEPDARIREIFNIIDEQLMPTSILLLKRGEPDVFKRYVDKRSMSTNLIENDVRKYLDSTGAKPNLQYLPLFVTKENDDRATELNELLKEYRSFTDVTYYDTFSVQWQEFAMHSDDIAKQLAKNPELVAELIELQIKRYRWIVQKKNTKLSLESKIKQCRTLADAQIMFPDLVSYLPEPPVKIAKVPVSPATDVLNALRGLGIPKDQEEAVAA